MTDYTWPLPSGFDTREYTRIRGRAPKAPPVHFTRPVTPRPPQSSQDAPRTTQVMFPRRGPGPLPVDTPEAFNDNGRAICPICNVRQRVFTLFRVQRKDWMTSPPETISLAVGRCGDDRSIEDSCGQRFLFRQEVA